MNTWLLAASLSYAVLAVAHSWLGERRFVRPLLDQPWQLGLPRRFAAQLVRWPWHLTSLAWLAAAVILGWAAVGGAIATPVIDVLAGLAAISAAVILISLRGSHPAWAVFAAAALTALVGAHGWPASGAARSGAGAAAAAVLLAISVLHVYWVVGGRRGAQVAVPMHADGTARFQPSAKATIAVAVALFGTAGIIASAAGLLPRVGGVRVLGLAAAAVFGLRMIGDFRVVGLFKRERRTAFARWDSMVFSPLSGALGLACAVAAA